MNTSIRQAVSSDKNHFIDFAVKLSKFNRNSHNQECRYDDFEFVNNAVKSKAEATFDNRNEDTLILIAELEGQPVGYALSRIYAEDETADNGTGRMDLFDEIFIDDNARTQGLAQKLLDETYMWMKAKGINRIKLHAYSWNEPAKRLYVRNGFKEYATSYEKYI